MYRYAVYDADAHHWSILGRRCTLLEAKLEDGDILVVQPRVSEEQLGRLRLPSIEKYLQYVQQRRIVLFKPLVSSVPPATGD